MKPRLRAVKQTLSGAAHPSVGCERLDGAGTVPADRTADLRQRGLRLEYAALGWNGVGSVLVLVATVSARSGARATGRELGSRVLQTEARVTVIDGLLAVAVLTGLVLNGSLGWWWADPAAAFVIAYYGIREGMHALWERPG